MEEYPREDLWYGVELWVESKPGLAFILTGATDEGKLLSSSFQSIDANATKRLSCLGWHYSSINHRNEM